MVCLFCFCFFSWTSTCSSTILLLKGCSYATELFLYFVKINWAICVSLFLGSLFFTIDLCVFSPLMPHTVLNVVYVFIYMYIYIFIYVYTYTYMYCCSFAKSCPTLCSPMDCSTPALPVPHYLLEFAQVHVHWIGNTIQPSHPLSPSIHTCICTVDPWTAQVWIVPAHLNMDLFSINSGTVLHDLQIWK